MTTDDQTFQVAQLDGLLRGLTSDAERAVRGAIGGAIRNGAQGSAPPARNGDRSMTQPEMFEVERRLLRLGFNPGPVDGVRGSDEQFETALRQFINRAKTDPQTAHLPAVKALDPEAVLQGFVGRQANPHNTGTNYSEALLGALSAVEAAQRPPAPQRRR